MLRVKMKNGALVLIIWLLAFNSAFGMEGCDGDLCKKILPELPGYSFEFELDENQSIQQVSIAKGNKAQVVSFEDVSDLSFYSIEGFIEGKDFNFDGHIDLVFSFHHMSNDINKVFLYDPKLDRFTYFDEFNQFSLEAENKTVRMFSYDSMYFNSEIYAYKFIGGKFTLVKSKVARSSGTHGAVVNETKEMVNGKMVLVDSRIHIYDDEDNELIPVLHKNLKKAHAKSMKYYKNKDIESAIKVFRPYFEQYEFMGTFTFQYMAKPKSIQGIINDYGYFLEQGGYYEDAIQVLTEVSSIAPKRVVTYLNLADAKYKLAQQDLTKRSAYVTYSKRYYDYRDIDINSLKKSYKALYQRYFDLMKEKGKESRVPARVLKILNIGKGK